jgi:hypothetical protein
MPLNAQEVGCTLTAYLLTLFKNHKEIRLKAILAWFPLEEWILSANIK